MAQNESYKPSGELVLLIRERLGLAQEQLAEKAECDAQAIRRIENGEDTSADTLERVAVCLRIDDWRQLLTDQEKVRVGLIKIDAGSLGENEPVDTFLILIDVVGYTPQSKEVGGEATL